MPKLGLNVAVIGVKLYNIIIHEIDMAIEKNKFWSNFMLTLQYIQNNSHRFKIYVANLVTQILEGPSSADWNFIEGIKNPADICSRGVSNPRLLCKHGCSNHSNLEMKAKCMTKNLSYLNLNISRKKW